MLLIIVCYMFRHYTGRHIYITLSLNCIFFICILATLREGTQVSYASLIPMFLPDDGPYRVETCKRS